MRETYTFRKRAFLNPISTNHTSHIHAHVESSQGGAYRWGDNVIYLADCTRTIELEFFLGTARQRRISLAKINLLIDVLTRFRDALIKEIALIEKGK
jgi:hypothetical protein